MATIDLRSGTGFPAKEGRHVVLTKRVDASVNNIGSGDTVQFFNIPAKTRVERVMVYIVTAEGGVATYTLGDAGSATRYLNGANLNATAGTIQYGDGATGATATCIGYFYESAGVLSAVVTGACDAVVIDIRVEMVDFS